MCLRKISFSTANLPYTFLRNSLYTDVFVNPQSVGAAVQFGALVTNAGEGRVNTASRGDLALVGAVVLTEEGHENKSYNLVQVKRGLSASWRKHRRGFRQAGCLSVRFVR